MNILLTAAGRRSYLVHYFRQALKGSGRVICANSIAGTPAMEAADCAYQTPLISDPAYLETLLEICRREKVRLLCSCHDLDVLFLSQHADAFRAIGVTPMLPSAEWAQLSLDKYACYQRLKEEGYPQPWQTVNLHEAQEAIVSGALKAPLILKARSGFGSLGLKICRNADFLETEWREIRQQLEAGGLLHEGDKAILIQEYISGPEYRLNVVNNFEGQYVTSFGCEVHEMRSGESDSATTTDHALFGDLGPRLSQTIGHSGIIGVDLLQSPEGLKIIEINPRFAGEYPFFHLAGADIPSALIAWIKGEEARKEWLTPQAGVRGYKDLVPKVARCTSSADSPGRNEI